LVFSLLFFFIDPPGVAMTLDVVTIEHSENSQVLIKPAAKVKFPLSPEDQNFIAAFKQKADQLQGVGLAAPQVGVSKQIIAISISEDAKAIRNNAFEVVPLTILINPQYTPAPDATLIADWEGCFSVRETYGKVPRYDKINYTAQNEQGETIQATAQGLTARVLQHEIDHIQGILITNRLTPDCVQGKPKEMMAQRLKEMTPAQQAIFEKITHSQEKATGKKF
jgi:peptide deformylase